MRPFLITGLPRSRTAWMSAFMTNGDITCRHEPLKHMRDISELTDYYRTHDGASDSGAGFFLPWIMEHINPKTVIIERNIEDVIDSMGRIGYPVGRHMQILRDKLEGFRNHPSVLWVKFDALNDKRIMQKVFWHLLPGAPFDDSRYLQFNDLRIEADAAKVKEIVCRNWNAQNQLYKEVASWVG